MPTGEPIMLILVVRAGAELAHDVELEIVDRDDLHRPQAGRIADDLRQAAVCRCASAVEELDFRAGGRVAGEIAHAPARRPDAREFSGKVEMRVLCPEKVMPRAVAGHIRSAWPDALAQLFERSLCHSALLLDQSAHELRKRGRLFRWRLVALDERAPVSAAIFVCVVFAQDAVFPFLHDPGTDPKLTFGQVDIERQSIGPGRQPAEIFYPQAPETIMQPSYKLKSSAEGIALLGWWLRRSGGADPCWVATTQKIGDLTGDLAIGATAVPTALPMSVAAGDTLALITTGTGAEFVRVQSIVGGVPQLAGPTTVAHPRRWTIVAPALLACHTDEELTLDFHRAGDDWIVTTTLAFREVVPEYAATDGEVRGTTLGRVPAEAWLFQIDLDYAGAVQSWYLTSWESGATTPDTQAWEYHPCEVDRIIRSIDLEDDSCTFRVRWWAGCPWENWRPGKLAATGTFTAYRAAVALDGTLGVQQLVLSGKLGAPQRDGAILIVKVLGANALFASRAPHAQMTPTCWKRLYGAKCRLDIANWKFDATVGAISGQSVTVNTISRSAGGGLPAGFGSAAWFWLGYLEWVDGSGHPQRAEVLDSTAISGGEITLTLGRSLGFGVGAEVVLVPGCDKTYDTCVARFANGANGPWHDMPAVSPSFKVPNSTATPAKK